MSYRLSLKFIFYNLLAIFVILTLLEITARISEMRIPPFNVDISGGFSQDSRVFLRNDKDSNLMVLNKNKLYSFHDQSFSLKKPIDVYRVFILGESSVYNLFPFSRKIEQKIATRIKNKKIEIINIGGNSYGSMRLKIVAKEIVQYSPDIVYMYLGHNEFEEVEQLDLLYRGNSKLFYYLFKSAFVRLMRQGWATYNIKKLKKAHSFHLLENPPGIALYNNFSHTKVEIKQRMAFFKNNIKEMLNIFLSNHIEVRISTIPSNIKTPGLWSKERNKYSYFYELYNKREFIKANLYGKKVLSDSLTRHQSSDLENNIIRELSDSYKIPLIELEKIIEKNEPNHISGERLFRDHCHLNDLGNQILIENFF
jgi:hypothetical protein